MPAGGGEVTVRIPASVRLRPLKLTERGVLRSLRARIVTAGLPEHVGARGEQSIRRHLRSHGFEPDVEVVRETAASSGAAVTLTAEYEHGAAGFSELGERGKPMEDVAKSACDAFRRWEKGDAAVDEHLADQLVLPLAFAHGESQWTTAGATAHLRTVLWAVSRFIPIRYALDEPAGKPVTVSLCPEPSAFARKRQPIGAD
jgi:RNA 3'-terminal phosphate cyclase (ATP)